MIEKGGTKMIRNELSWGKPGGGAPNHHDVRVRNLESRGIYPEIGQVS